MRLVIDTEKIKNSDLSISEFLFILSCYLEDPITSSTYKIPHSKDYITCEGVDEYGRLELFSINPKGEDAILGIMADTEIQEQKKIDEFDDIASAIIEIYPKGRKEGTNYLWRDSKVSIARRLKTLATKYGVSFTKEQAMKATKNYVDSFNGMYRTMRLLKYFIYKIEIKDGKEELVSEMAAMLENEGELEAARQDWMSTMI